jgi:hypothetical protein
MQREKLLMGFRPLHPAIRHFCQLCGIEVSSDSSVTIPSRPSIYEADSLHLFCQTCSPEVDRICNLIATEEQRQDVEYFKARDLKLKEIARNEIELVMAAKQHDGGDSSAPPSDERLSPRSPSRRALPKRNGMIPNPNA